MESNDSYLEYAKASRDKFISYIIKGKSPEVGRDAVFMAGNPGAGKLEVAIGLAESYDNHVIIGVGYFHIQFPDYNGRNSSLFQEAPSWLVEQAFRYVLDHSHSFILDTTFAMLSVEKNISQALKRHFRMTVFYVYQDPKITWEFMQECEIAEGHHVPKKTFINAFFKSRGNIAKVKSKYPDVLLHIIIKDYTNNISKVRYTTDNLELLLPLGYNRKDLEVQLHD